MIGPRLVDKPLVLYGMGKLGMLAKEIFDELNIHSIMIDKNCDLHHVKNPEDCLLAICVATEPYSQVITPLIASGWETIVPVWDIIEEYPEVGIRNGWFADSDIENEEEYVSLHLDDEDSREHYYEFRSWHRCRIQSPTRLPISPSISLLSTLADIRNRQRVEMFVDDPMESISIHSEGCELKTIENGMPLFKKYRPKIDVTCYHSRDGLWKIEKYLIDNLPDYKWTFRLHAYMGQTAVMYGMPKERI